MTDKTDDSTQPEGIDPGSYLNPREQLLTISYNVIVKSFRFHAILTDQRVLLIDHNEQRKGVFARELLRTTLNNCFFETSEKGEPVLVLVVQTDPDEQKTMKLTFSGRTGRDDPELEQWIILTGTGRRTPFVQELKQQNKADITASQVSPPYDTPGPTGYLAHAHRDATRSIQIRKPSFRRGGQFGPEVPAVPQSAGKSPEARFCHQCGERILQNARFCPFCGTSLR